jgi:hypothetical protein
MNKTVVPVTYGDSMLEKMKLQINGYCCCDAADILLLNEIKRHPTV